MKKNKSMKGILLIVLLLAIGFATVTTTLVINGTANIAKDQTDFEENVIFANPTLTYSEAGKPLTTGSVHEVRLSTDKKTIEFTTEVLTKLNETATLTYDIKNDSQYDATLQNISCTVKNGANTITADASGIYDYIKVTPSSVAGTIVKGSTKTGNTIVVELARSYTGDTPRAYTIECSIAATGEPAN